MKEYTKRQLERVKKGLKPRPYSKLNLIDDLGLYGPIKKEYRYQYLQSMPAGLLGSFISFLIVCFGIRGASRGIRHLALWIFEGFKDERN